jgi:hypothetical protein
MYNVAILQWNKNKEITAQIVLLYKCRDERIQSGISRKYLIFERCCQIKPHSLQHPLQLIADIYFTGSSCAS